MVAKFSGVQGFGILSIFGKNFSNQVVPLNCVMKSGTGVSGLGGVGVLALGGGAVALALFIGVEGGVFSTGGGGVGSFTGDGGSGFFTTGGGNGLNSRLGSGADGLGFTSAGDGMGLSKSKSLGDLGVVVMVESSSSAGGLEAAA